MAYTPTEWKDHIVEYPNRFRVVDNGDGTVNILDEHGNVIQQGTPVDASRLNKMEKGIKEAHDLIDAHLNEITSEMVSIQGTDITSLTTMTVSFSQNRKPKRLKMYATTFWNYSTNRSSSVGEMAELDKAQACLTQYGNGIQTVSIHIAYLGLEPGNGIAAIVTNVQNGQVDINWQIQGNLPPSDAYNIRIFAYYHG